MGVKEEQMLQFLSENIEAETKNKESDTDSLYKSALNHLMGVEKDMSTKTEFNDDREVFTASKLEFLGIFAGVPIAKDFLNILEKKRVSKGRKGRGEIIETIKRREEEQRILRDRMNEHGYRQLTTNG